MRQIDSNRFEEFITLRDELREALAHGRFILYVTSLLILGALSWYVGKAEPPQVSPAAQLTYAVLALMVVGFLIHLQRVISIEERGTMLWAILIGSIEMLAFTQMSRYLTTQQRKQEYDWRVIRSSRERQDQIHDEYESVPITEDMLIRLPSPSLIERFRRGMRR